MSNEIEYVDNVVYNKMNSYYIKDAYGTSFLINIGDVMYIEKKNDTTITFYFKHAWIKGTLSNYTLKDPLEIRFSSKEETESRFKDLAKKMNVNPQIINFD